jgi:hypothetical protein
MQNLNDRLYEVLHTLYFSESRSDGEIFDKILGLTRFITKTLKIAGYDHSEIIDSFGLHDDVDAGMPTDSESILAYSVTANICNSLFAEKNEENMIKSEKIEEFIQEYESNMVPSKIH